MFLSIQKPIKQGTRKDFWKQWYGGDRLTGEQMGQPSTQIYFPAYNSNEHCKVTTAGLLFCKPLSFALLISQEYEWITRDGSLSVSLTLQGKSFVENRLLTWVRFRCDVCCFPRLWSLSVLEISDISLLAFFFVISPHPRDCYYLITSKWNSTTYMVEEQNLQILQKKFFCFKCYSVS